jgi:hypothetical protein
VLPTFLNRNRCESRCADLSDLERCLVGRDQ